MSYLILLFACIFVNNAVFNQVYGICPFLGVSKKTDQALGMGVAVIFVMTAATAVTWPIYHYVLAPLSVTYLQTIVFILVIAALVQFLETVLKKYIPALHKSLGIYLPLITTNCAVLGVTVDSISASYSFVASLFAAVGSGVGFLVAMLLFAGVRSRVDDADVPKSWKGLPITLGAAAIVSLSFRGFSGLITVPTKAEAPELYALLTQGVGGGNLALDILIAVAVVTVIALLVALLLVIAARYMAVEESPLYTAARAALPGANCGACGYAGCDAYAKALAEDPGVPTNLCVPGADAASRALSEALGREFMDVVEQIAVIACDGNCNVSPAKNDFHGVDSCAAAKMYFGGPSACAYGCIGLGDCAKVCPNDAICVVDGIARVDTRLCVGCGLCRDACPQSIIKIFPDVSRTVVLCSSKENGAATRKACRNGCIGCKKCEKTCAHGAVTVIDNLAVIDYDKCVHCGECTRVCPTGAIMDKDLSGYHRIKHG